MALKATICKAELNVADMNRNYYHSHHLTLAQHPSETEERMMMRLIVFSLHAHEDLVFTKGLSTEDEPDIWQKDLIDHVVLWIDLGQIDEKRIRKACSKSDRVIIYTYQSRSAKPWWQKIEPALKRFDNLSVVEIENTSSTPIESLFSRSMQLSCNIQDNTVYVSSIAGEVELTLTRLM
jgi:uncharacterized protein YaeQ